MNLCRICLYRYKLSDGSEVCSATWSTEDLDNDSDSVCALYKDRYNFMDN